MQFRALRRLPIALGWMSKRPVVTEQLRSFDRPALVVWATEDRVMPPEHGRRLAELLPQARLVEIEDSWTLIPEDRPAEFAAAIRDFVREGTSGDSRHGDVATLGLK